MAKKAAEKIKPLFTFRKERKERFDEALSSVLEALTSSTQVLARQKKCSDTEVIDFSNIPLLWNRAAVQIRQYDQEIALLSLSLAKNFSETVDWEESDLAETCQTLDTLFQMVGKNLEKKLS